MPDSFGDCGDPGDLSTVHDFEAECERIRILQQFVSDVSHDLRTPLSVINSAAYMLNLKVEGEEQAALVARIREQVKRLDQIIDSMLTMIELDSNPPSRTYLRINVNTIAEGLYREYKSLANERDISLAYQVSRVQLIMADQADLWLALTNVVANGIRFTPPGGTVIIRTFQRGDQVVFEVQDTGVGISPEDLPHVFERFYRGDKARRTVTGGAGLGLAITRRIVDYHGGDIEVESQVGAGTTIRIVLPVLAAAQPSE